MMNLLMVVTKMIEEADLGEEGVDLFVGTMPADVTKGVMLRAPLDPTEVDDGMEDFFPTRFQIIVRDTDAVDGYNRANAISKALKTSYLSRAGLVIAWMNRESLPIQYPKGDADDIETSVRMRVGYGETAP